MSGGVRGPWVALAALCACFFMVMLDSTIVTVAIPAMLGSLDATLNQVIWVNSVYLLANTVPLLLTGRLGDRFGPKRVLVFGLVLFLGASLWCGLSTSAGSLIAARAVQGLGAAAMTPQTLSFITGLFPPEKRGAPIAVWGAVAGVATITGPVVGGLLVQHVGWQWIFLLNLPIGAVGLVLGVWLLPDWRPAGRVRLDTTGALLASAGLGLLVFGLQNGQHYHWGTIVGPVGVLPVIGIGLALIGGFTVYQRRARDPLLPRGLFDNPIFSYANLTHAALGFATTGMFLPLVIYVQSVLGLDPVASSLLCAPMAVAAGGAAWVAGRSRVPGRTLIMTGLGGLAAGTVVLALLAEPDTEPLILVPGLVVAGLGIGLVFSPLTASATLGMPPHLIGAASGVFNTSRQVGGVLGSATTGLLLQVGLGFAVPQAAREYAKFLPPRYVDEFVERITAAAQTASQFGGEGPAVPSDWSPAVVEKVRELATDAFHLGFTNAAKATLVLPVVVLILGMVCAAGIRTSPTGNAKNSGLPSERVGP
ncbi:MFS transporter [Actinokineospora globicatena]|uniref:MFS transporter n=1 Tax=Actinokineospora globicatena TaxID=103729 RepID=UPI0020A4E2E9|nr:MFS transporter [Actinokineospora globicatena]MCP2302060.1 drug resistance transporter, EmrB/QacA subfamily [Actinokineospora globicatena]GLW76278.1 MFS transporter [Actinokineospora globicatena]GLW83114.1 MFS transporter [Actinokineospora globicatena]